MAQDAKRKEHTGSGTVTIFVNNVSCIAPKESLSGLEIKALGGVPADYELFQVKGDHTLPVGNEQEVRVHNDEHFRAIPAGTFGSNAPAA